MTDSNLHTPEEQEMTDRKDCLTRPDGECISEGRCVHDYPLTLAGVEHALIDLVPPRERSERMQAIDAVMEVVTGLVGLLKHEAQGWKDIADSNRAAYESMLPQNRKIALSDPLVCQQIAELEAGSETGAGFETCDSPTPSSGDTKND